LWIHIHSAIAKTPAVFAGLEAFEIAIAIEPGQLVAFNEKQIAANKLILVIDISVEDFDEAFCGSDRVRYGPGVLSWCGWNCGDILEGCTAISAEAETDFLNAGRCQPTDGVLLTGNPQIPLRRTDAQKRYRLEQNSFDFAVSLSLAGDLAIVIDIPTTDITPAGTRIDQTVQVSPHSVLPDKSTRKITSEDLARIVDRTCGTIPGRGPQIRHHTIFPKKSMEFSAGRLRLSDNLTGVINV
jgi:hypothetical protein